MFELRGNWKVLTLNVDFRAATRPAALIFAALLVLFVLAAGPGNAQAEEVQINFDHGLVDLGDQVAVDALGEGGTASLVAEYDDVTGGLTIPADAVDLPSRQFENSGITGTVSFAVGGTHLNGTWNPSVGKLTVRGPIRMSVELDGGATCGLTTTLTFSSDSLKPYRGQRYTSGLSGPGAVSAGWSELPPLTGAPECAFLNTLVNGPGGIWLSTGVEQPPMRPISLSPPALEGNGRVGSRLTCKPGLWDGYTKMTYVWTRDGEPFENLQSNGLASNWYQVAGDDAGSMFACHQVVGNSNGETVGPTSNGVTAIGPDSPVNIEPPTITDSAGREITTAAPGDRVMCHAGVWEGHSWITFYWTRDGEDFDNLKSDGLGSREYRVDSDDIGKEIGCGQVAKNQSSPEVRAGSSTVLIVADPPVNIAPPSMDGSPVAPSTLTCHKGEWEKHSGWTFQWVRDGILFENEGPNGLGRDYYKTTASDVGSTIACREIAWNGSGQVIGPESSAVTVVFPPAPVNVKAPYIAHGSSSEIPISTIAASQTLRCPDGVWENANRVEREWVRDGVVVEPGKGGGPGGTSRFYKTEARETGSVIMCREKATNIFTTVIAESSPVTLTGPTVDPDDYDLSLPVAYVNVEDRARIEEKEVYLKAQMHLDPNGADVEPVLSGLKIRGRGNSTWGLPKNPYKLKLNQETEMLGMPANKSWEFLANHLDRSQMRNSVAFYLAWQTSLNWSPRDRFIELVLNGEYSGIYAVTENKKVGKDKVNIQPMKAGDSSGEALTGGYLLELDARLEQNDEIGFRTGQNVPIVVKDPKAPVSEQFSYIQDYVEDFEDALFAEDFATSREYAEYIDIDTFVDWYLVNELTTNFDAGWSSTFFHKPRGGKLKMGPVWDFDRSIGNTGDRLQPPGGATGWRVRDVTTWLSRLWKDPVFAQRVAERWQVLKPRFMTVDNFIDGAAQQLEVAREADAFRWEYEPVPLETPSFLKNWLAERTEWLDARIPEVASSEDGVVINEVNCTDTDWVELYNPGSHEVDIGGWLLTDDPLDWEPPRDSHRYRFPAGTIVPPGEFHLVAGWEDGFEFGISCDGTVTLADQDDAFVDTVELDDLSSSGRSFTRVPDGADAWAWRNPTPNAPVVLYRRPLNDDFADARDVVGSQAVLKGTTYGATRQFGEPAHSTDGKDASLWYRWTAPATGVATIDACDSGDDQVSVAPYTGLGLVSLTQVTATESACDGPGSGRTATFPVEAGVFYFIAVVGDGAASPGSFELNLGLVTPLPRAPTITDHPELSGVEREATFSFEPAAGDPGAPAAFECRLDDGDFEACDSPKTYTGLSIGHHTFRVRVVSEQGTGPAAEFHWKTVSNMLSLDKVGQGQISADPAGPYSWGDEVTITASPAQGSTFTGFTGCVADGDSCIVSMKGDSTVTAEFEAISNVLSLDTDGDGQISADPAGPYSWGDEVTITASPAQGSTFTGFTGCVADGDSCIVSMKGDSTVTAEFQLIPQKPRFTKLKVQPNRRVLRRGKSAVIRVKLKNSGNARAKQVRVCVKAPKRLVRVKRCFKLGQLASKEAKMRKFRVKVKPNAGRGKRAVLRFRATGRGVKPVAARAVVRVR